ncbi:hypothetical protein ACP4OV_010399 [Aristida adscensionis]
MELSTIINAPLILALIISLLILASTLTHKKSTTSLLFKNNRRRRRPPGPWRLPLVGSLHHMLTSQPQAALRDLAGKHGPVMYLRLGQVDAVVVSSPAAAQAVLREHDLSFASRPSLLGTEIAFYGNRDLAFAPYGAYWRAVRKLCTVELLSPRKVRHFAPARHGETMALVAELRAAAAAGEPVNVGALIVSCANSIAGLATFGGRCGGERKEQFLAAMAVVMANISGFCVSDLFPSLGFVDVVTGTRRRIRRAHRELEDVLDKIVAECEARRRERKARQGGGEEDDLVSVMLRIKDEEGEESEFNIKAIIVDMFTAGTETTSSTAEWVMSELMRNPSVMAKAQAEVRRVFNNKRPCDHETHMDELCYIRMVIKETLRLHPPIPLLLPHLCRETCDISGFKVEKGSRVIVNAWAIARSPEYWDDAEKFIPERFENSTVDYKGSQFHYLPFGSGRRMCPAMGFGLATLELIIARLLYYFDWSLPDGMQREDLDMGMTVGVTARKTNQLHLVALPYDVPMEI